MPKFLALCGAVLLFSVAAPARDDSNSVTPPPTSEATPASPPQYSSFNLPRWQVGVNFNYIRFSPGNGLNMYGFNTSVAGYANDWFGLEGNVGANFGTTPSGGGSGPFSAGNVPTRLILYGGGPHLAYRHDQKFEPWVHALLGGAHFRFSQTGPPTASLAKTNAFAYTLGGGLDFKLGPHFACRSEVDFLGTRFFSTWQKSVQVQTGLVFKL
jgi:hypothetical protein